MIGWLHHPRYARRRDELIELFRDKIYHFPTVRPVVFLCGAVNSPVRDRIAEYLRSKTDALVFYADEVWARLARADLNALEMENQLAGLADIVMIVVESPGTFCELGAFSLSPQLRTKLLPIIDLRFKDSPSFINTGPVRWIDRESTFRPAIYADHNVILTAMPEIGKRLAPFRYAPAAVVSDVTARPKYLLFLICDLVAVIGPASLEQVRFYIERIVGPPATALVEGILGAAAALNLVRFRDEFYYCELNRGELRYFRRKKFLLPSAERAKFLSIMLTIPEAAAALSKLNQQPC